ncbi:MAG: thioredoxin domain-containing protein, partial [Patescibacteria group bacterium]
MQKLNLKIKGMHCKSCVMLIEDKVKSVPGVLHAKVNLETQKAVVAYEEANCQTENIYKAIKSAGDYEVETEEEEKPERHLPDKPPDLNIQKDKSFWLGFVTNLFLVSLIANAVLVYNLLDKNSKPTVKSANTVVTPKITSVSTPQPAAKQTFNISKTDHIRGDVNSPVTLVEFSDFECPFCARHKPTLDKILEDYKGKVRLVYKHFPLSFHANSQKTAEAAECAAEQGKFWEYHDKIFENQSAGLNLEKFKQWANDIGLNSAKFNEWLNSGKFTQKIKDDAAEGAAKGV